MKWYEYMEMIFQKILINKIDRDRINNICGGVGKKGCDWINSLKNLLKKGLRDICRG